ncbi:MAG TPA: hypothetical protein DEA55_08720 [Rhodospirillaceae bacterium]|nr:hypothetical protein [Rhodospirillaceae bacterium]
MKWLLVLVTIVASAVGGAAAYYYLGHAKEQPMTIVAQPDVRPETAASETPVNDPPAQEPGIEKKFETLLNDLLKNVSGQMAEYKNQRKILVEAVKPVNLRSPAYVKENHTLVQSVAAELRQKMDALMQVFSQTGTEVESLVSTQDSETRDSVLAKWKAMENEQVGKYISFFEGEEEDIRAYEALISFLNETASDFEVDLENDRITYKSPENEARYQELLAATQKPAENQEEAVKTP